jgi:hypothetical protein
LVLKQHPCIGTLFVPATGAKCALKQTFYGFNYLTTRHFQLNLHAIRHIWIGLSIRVTDSFVDSQNPSFKQIVKNYIARQSHHDIRCDRAVYAGEKGSIRGHEAVNQRLFQRLSKNFDSELFGCQIYARLPKQ